MNRSAVLLLLTLYIFSCSPKLATKSTVKDYDEDLSSYRPSIEVEEPDNTDSENEFVREPYVPPTHDVNSEMAVALDSIIFHNSEKVYTTYTIQVYIGRSREEANQVREKVYRVLPDEQPELGYRQPSWKVTVGEYLDHVDAFKTLTLLKKTFPEAMLVRERKYIE
jgi:hypothetical protein